jgi:hypothetical protein
MAIPFLPPPKDSRASIGACLRKRPECWNGGKHRKGVIMNFRRVAIRAGFLPVVLGATILAGCGGGGDGGPGGGTGSDEEFVSDICKAGLNFTKSLDDIFKDPSALADEDKAIEKLADSFEDFANAFAKANPPADLKAWHSDASKQLKEGVKQIKDGDLEGGVFAGDTPFPEPPGDAGDRLTRVAEENKDCIDADFAFTE